MKAQTALGIFIAFGVVLLIGLSFFTTKAYAEPCNCFDNTDCAVGETCDPDNTMCTVTDGNVGMCVAGGGFTCTPACTSPQVCQSGTCVTPPTTPPGTDTGVAIGVGDVTSCSGTTGCAGATCRWSKCATTANPTKIEFTFTIPNTCNGNSIWSGGRWVPANPCSTNAVSFPASVKAAYANNCLHSILLTEVQSDDYGKVCAGPGCSASSAPAAGIIPGPGGGGGGGGGNSFVSGTPILLVDGSSKPIEEIKIGDKVRSFDPETGTFSIGNVTSILTRDVQESYILDFDDGSSVGVTGTHPFYVKTAASGVPTIHKYFVQVKDLMAGDRVYKAYDNRAVSVKITVIRQISKPVTVYNFNVEPFHTYIANNMVVHNIKSERGPFANVVAKPTFSVTGFATASGGVIYTAASNAVWAPNVDATNAFDKTDPKVSLYVVDTIAANYGGNSRTIGATFKVIILNPSPTQKCVMDTATGKPKIVPLCAGTTAECTQTPTEIPTLTAPRCIDLTSQNGWQATGPAVSKCVDSNQYKAMVTPQAYKVSTCTKYVPDLTFSKYGNYTTNATAPGTPPRGGSATRDNWTTRTSCGTLGCNPATGLCKTGGGGGCPDGQTKCSDGVCRTDCGGTCIKPPLLNSINATPRRVAPTGIVTMSSIGSSSESITDAGSTTPRRMKVKLECGTAEGNIQTTSPPLGGDDTACRTRTNPASILASVRAARAAYGAMVSAEEAAVLLNKAAWDNKDAGWGLLSKTGGNSCPHSSGSISCDILFHKPSGLIYDVLGSGPGPEGPGPSNPQWGCTGRAETSKWVAPTTPTGGGTAVCAGKTPGWYDPTMWGGCPLSECRQNSATCSSCGEALAYCDGTNWKTDWDPFVTESQKATATSGHTCPCATGLTGGVTSKPTFSVTGFATGGACETCAEKGQTDKYQSDVKNAANKYLASHPEIGDLPSYGAADGGSDEGEAAVAQLRDGVIAILIGQGFHAETIGSYPQIVAVWKDGDPDKTGYRVTAGGGKIHDAIQAGYCGGHETFGGTDIIPSGCTSAPTAARDGTSGSCQTGSFTANLCSGQLADNNPTCTLTLPPEWKRGGFFQNLYCRLKDESGMYSNSSRTSIIVDNNPPTSRITEPVANSVQTANFQIKVTDADDSGLDKCYYTTSGNTATPIALPRGNIALSNPYRVWRPLDVAYSTKSDVALAVWSTEHQGKVIGQFITDAGALRGGNVILGSSSDFVGSIKITYDEDDDLFLVAWGAAAGNNMGPTYGSLVKADGTFVKQNFVIMNNCDLGIHASSSGNIAYSSGAKKFFVSCTRGVITRGSIIGNSVTPTGTVGNEVVVTGDGMFGSSAAAGGSSVLATWFDQNGIAYGRLYNPNGAALTGPIRISTGTLGGYVSLVAFYDTTRNEYTAFYWGSVGRKLYKRTIGPSGTLGTESTVFTNNNVGVSDIAYNPLTGSYFVADQHQDDNGNGYIKISSGGAASGSVRVSEDMTLPHYTPAIIATGNDVPLTIMNQAGDAYAQFGGLGGAISGGRLRICNSQTTITVGPGNDCPDQGSCTVSAFATDTVGNIGAPDSRSFTINLILTNITSPLDGSNQTGNFSVNVQDRDFASTTNSTITCTYDIYSVGSTSTKIVDNAARRCNSNFTVSIGPDGDCNLMGQGSCKVVAKVNKTMNGTRIEDTSTRFYNIDWVTPFSEIVSAPSNWVTSDFTISVSDNAQGVASRISKCQYKVVSNATQTVSWTDRACGIGAPASVMITVGPGKNCRHEGGDACTIFVRPIGMSGLPGVEDNVSVPIIFNVTDTNGFSVTTTTQTERGLNFSGTTRQELRLYTFYVCNKNSNVNSCIAAYNSNNRGANKPNFCGSLLGKCELRCSDQTVLYYFAARGTPVGQSATVTVVSTITSAACPTFNIGQINEWYQIFTDLDVQIGTEIGIVDSSISQNGETAIANNETLVILREALLITKDHLKNMTMEMQDLTVTKARQLIQRSLEKRDDIDRLLRGIRPPTRVLMTVDMPTVVRFNRSMTLTATINKDGPTDAYGTVYCTITKPGNLVQQNRSSCLVLGGPGHHSTAYSVPFMPDRLGTWTYSCKLGRSVRPDCSFEVNQTPVSGTFAVLPAASTFIASLSTPDNAVRGSVVTTNTVVTNPDSSDRFVNVTCNFRYISNGQLITRRNSSSCISAATGDTTVPIKMYASTLGEWNVTGCSVRSSSTSNCASSALDNTSLATASYMVMLPDSVFIESVGVPQAPVLNNSLLSIPVIINNPTQDVAYVTLNCGIIKPVGSVTVTDQNGVDSGRTSSFTLDTTTDRVGRWNISSCNVSVSPDPSFSGSSVVYTRNNVGTFNVIARSNLTITAVNSPTTVQNNTLTSLSVSITNPSNARYGRVSCTVRDPVNRVHVNSSACLIVNSNAQRVFAINFFMNRTGEWHITQCSVYGSASADCSSYSLHDRKDFIDNSFNSTVSCTAGLYHATNPATSVCQEFGNNCNIPTGWINITAGSCPGGMGVVYVSSVSVPTSDVINNSNVNIDTLVTNPINDDRFGQVSCFVKSPSGATQLLTSSCEGIAAANARTYRTILTVNKVGVWNVTTCSVNASTSCASATLQHILNASKTFNVIRGANLSFVSFSLPPDTLVNNTATTAINIRNPSDAARYARVFCSFRNSQNQMTSNTTSCLQVAGTSTPTFGVNIFANVAGTWNVDSCTLRGSLDSSCSELHDSESGIGAFNITTVSPPPALAELFISNLSASSAAFNDSRISVLVYGRNNNLANSSYAIVGCEFLNPLGGLTRQASSCTQVTANSTVRFGVSQLLNIPGTWTVANCFINASNTNNCAPSILNNVSAETRTITVSLPPNLYITGVTAPSADVVNNTNVNIDVFVNNPLNDDKYGLVNCIIQDPNGNNYTRAAACSSVPRQTSNKKYNVSVVANIVGSWNVRNCSVSSSTSSSCASSSPAGELINGDTFNVIRGYNLTLSSLSVPQSVYVNQPLRVAYTLRNPSTSDRFGRVTCTMTKGGQSVVNTSSCMTIAPESFIDGSVLFTPASTGTWTVTCVAQRSFDASCTSVEAHDTDSQSFNVTYPPDLFIQSIDVPSLALKDQEVFSTLKIRNTALTNMYGFAQCTFKNRLNETTYNSSECLNMTADTTIVSLGVTPALRGNLTVYNCYINATSLSNCSSSRVHNISTTEKSFNVFAPVLSFVGNVNLAYSNLMVGDIADIVVNVKNTGERAYLAFVNCTLINPLGVSYMLTTTPQTLQMDETMDFHPQRTVDISGTWKVGTCSIYSISSPPKLEAQKTVNQIFDVLYAASTDECNSNVPCQTGFTCENGACVAIPQPLCSASNCPGTKDGCYCSSDRCVSCGQGYTCSQSRCVPETPVINTCRSTNDCVSGNVCVNGVCQQKPAECFTNSDCGSNYECKSGSCVVSVQKPLLDEKIIYFLIILLAVIMVPIILFIYIKRSI